jgi:hypothetical protein
MKTEEVNINLEIPTKKVNWCVSFHIPLSTILSETTKCHSNSKMVKLIENMINDRIKKHI